MIYIFRGSAKKSAATVVLSKFRQMFFKLIRHYLGRRFIAGASYGGLEMKNSLNEFRSFRFTRGENLHNSLYEQDLSIFAHSDPEITNRQNT
ncbi:hypothetical protein ES703_76038 [subsurface metagenome]